MPAQSKSAFLGNPSSQALAKLRLPSEAAMKPALFLTLILLAASVFAQDQSAIDAAQAACGPKTVSFDVKLDSAPHPAIQPEAGKALVFIVQDAGTVSSSVGSATVKIGLDGAWVGANHHNSYFSLSVEPGEHHLCANWQSHFDYLSRLVGLAHFTADAGKVYYFRVRAVSTSLLFLDLDRLDSDQGKLLVASYPLNVSHPKK